MARRRTIHGRTERRRTDWARQSGSFTLTTGTASATTVDLLTQYKADGGNTAGVTVARTHLRMAITSDVTGGDDFYWGLYRGAISNVGSELSGSPTPFTDPYNDWAMWQHLVASLDVLSTTGYAHYWPATNNHEYDIRSKRRIDQVQMGWLLCVEAGVLANTIVVNYQASTLVMLP
jgi:hypothetical protein